MIDPFIIILFVIVLFVACVWLAINNCADAELHGNRLWWRKALFRARQRIEYKEFCHDVERKNSTEIHYTQKG